MTEQNVELFCSEVLNQSKPDDLSFSVRENSKSNRALSTEDGLSNETINDLISNRYQREKFTKQIIVIMCVEIAFIACLILGVFMVFCFNAFAPKISFNFPPIFITASLIFVYVYLYRFMNSIPNFRLTCKKIRLKKHEVNPRVFAKACLTIVFVYLLNVFAREHHTVYYEPIILTGDVIKMVFYTALVIFVKTTILAGYIINGLYKALNKNSLKPEK